MRFAAGGNLLDVLHCTFLTIINNREYTVNFTVQLTSQQGLTQTTVALLWNKSMPLKLSKCCRNSGPKIDHQKCLPNEIHSILLGISVSHEVTVSIAQRQRALSCD